MARELVDRQLLKPWQAKYLLGGRHRLKIGSYVLLNRLERDRLGDRFEALHKQLDRKVDLQIFPAEFSQEDRHFQGFLTQAAESAKLDHPHLTHVFDIDREGGRYFLVVEHVDGRPLNSVNDLALDSFCHIIIKAWTDCNTPTDLEWFTAAYRPTTFGSPTTASQKSAISRLHTLIRELDTSDSIETKTPENDIRDLGRVAGQFLAARYSSSESSHAKLAAIFKQLAW